MRIVRVLPWQHFLPALTLGLMLVAGMTDTWSPFDVQIQQEGRTCQAQWCQPGQADRDAEAYVAAQVMELMAGRDCWVGESGRIPRTVLVHKVGSTDVREVPFASGFAAASRGDVWVDGSCA